MPATTVEKYCHAWNCGCCSKRRHSSRNRGTRSAGLLPAMIAPLIAPIEVPITQSGSMPASCSASKTPTW
jgi:hypothetical protein